MQAVVLTAYKYSGRPHCTQPLLMAHESKHMRVLLGRYHAPFIHHTRHRVFAFADEVALYFCSATLPYLAVVIVTRQGQLRLYCHMATPCSFGDGVVRYIDLDLDVVGDPGGGLQVIDQDDYQHSLRELCYPAHLMHLAERGARQVQADIAAARYPFDDTMHRFARAVLAAGDDLPGLDGVFDVCSDR